LALARAVLHEPELLLIDEPPSGLDPESAQSVLEMVRDMTSGGRTVLMCTHLLLEAEGLADEVVIIERGTTLMWGPPQELARRYWPHRRVTITAAQEGSSEGRALDMLADHDGVLSYRRSGDEATMEVASAETTADLITSLTSAGVRLQAVEPYIPSLEDLYFAVRQEQRTTTETPHD